jgi:hypothetical protein
MLLATASALSDGVPTTAVRAKYGSKLFPGMSLRTAIFTITRYCRTVSAIPAVKWAGLVRVPRDDQPPIHFDVELEADETRWLVVRISDPDAEEPSGPSAVLDGWGAAVAYSSPFFVAPSGRS